MKQRAGFCTNCGVYAVDDGLGRWCADCVRAAVKLVVVELLAAGALAILWRLWL